jgi:ferritin
MISKELVALVNNIIATEEIVRQIELHESSQAHVMGLQGFKRFHRYNAMDRAKHSMMLRCHLEEYHHVEPYISINFETPKDTATQVESLKIMYDKSKSHIETLSTAMKMAFDEGETLLGDYIGCLIKDESKEAEQYNRIILDMKREGADVNFISHELHEKYKKKEKKYFNYKG